VSRVREITKEHCERALVALPLTSSQTLQSTRPNASRQGLRREPAGVRSHGACARPDFCWRRIQVALHIGLRPRCPALHSTLPLPLVAAMLRSLTTSAFNVSATEDPQLSHCMSRGAPGSRDAERLSPRRDMYAEVYKLPAPQPIQVTYRSDWHPPSAAPAAPSPATALPPGIERRNDGVQKSSYGASLTHAACSVGERPVPVGAAGSFRTRRRVAPWRAISALSSRVRLLPACLTTHNSLGKTCPNAAASHQESPPPYITESGGEL
jgi:hypothetical protein